MPLPPAATPTTAPALVPAPGTDHHRHRPPFPEPGHPARVRPANPPADRTEHGGTRCTAEPATAPAPSPGTDHRRRPAATGPGRCARVWHCARRTGLGEHGGSGRRGPQPVGGPLSGLARTGGAR